MFRLLLVIAIGTISNLVAADVSGNWSGTMESASGPIRIFLTVDQHDQGVSGTVSTEDETNQVPIEKPELRGDVLTFQVHDNANRILKFRLTLTSLVLTGEAGIDGQLSRVSLWRADLMSGARNEIHKTTPLLPFSTHHRSRC